MNSYIQTALFSLLLLCMGTKAMAQDFKADIRQINQAYLRHQSFGAKLVYQLFATHESEKAMRTLTGTIRNQGKLKYSKMAEVESLINEDYALLINHEQQTISIQKSFTHNPVIPDVNLDSLSSFCEEIHFLELGNQLLGYEFVFKKYEYERIRVVFDPKSHVIHKFVFYQAEPIELIPGQPAQAIRMEIAFTQIQVNEPFPATTFSATRFVKKVGKDFQPIASLASYRLVNFLPHNQ